MIGGLRDYASRFVILMAALYPLLACQFDLSRDPTTKLALELVSAEIATKMAPEELVVLEEALESVTDSSIFQVFAIVSALYIHGQRSD